MLRPSNAEVKLCISSLPQSLKTDFNTFYEMSNSHYQTDVESRALKGPWSSLKDLIKHLVFKLQLRNETRSDLLRQRLRATERRSPRLSVLAGHFLLKSCPKKA